MTAASFFDAEPDMRVSIFTLAVLVAAPCAAQQARPAAISIDSSASVDTAVDERGTQTTGTVVDSVVSVGLGHGFEATVRPWAMRTTTMTAWNRQIWLATVRYQRTGRRAALRVDGGLIPSPVGLANMMLRPQLNPTIGLPSSLFQPLPQFESKAPRATLLGALYPYGVNATLSTARWDARVAMIDTTPLRMRRVFAPIKPPRFANLVVGGGVTPVVGLRIGVSLTQGGWRRGNEVPLAPTIDPATVVVPESYQARVLTLESEYAVRHTSVSGEWVRDTIDLASSRSVTPSGWFVQGQQTLTPRWFAAGRVERITAPALATAGTYRTLRLSGVESVIGFRLTPEFTLRGGHRAKQTFGGTSFDHAAIMSLVWSKRWM
jgi:hypothetical protein